MLNARVGARGCGLIVLLLTGVAGMASVGQDAPPASIASGVQPAAPVPPTPADFVGYPSCMIYAAGLDTRIRVRAARAAAVCTSLSRQLSSAGVRWSLKPQRLRHILSPICRFANPRGQLELEVVDAAANSARGQRICASLARAGWVDLSRPWSPTADVPRRLRCTLFAAGRSQTLYPRRSRKVTFAGSARSLAERANTAGGVLARG